jgi:hypothetical protein
MSAPRRHRFLLTTRYGPAELFRDGRAACRAGVEFDFDWMARRVGFLGADRGAVLASVEQLQHTVARAAAPGQLLAAPAEALEDGRTRVRIGVLLQTPDIYRDLIVGLLVESGLRGVSSEDTDEGALIMIAEGPLAIAFPYSATIMAFPVPVYITVRDLGSAPVPPA